MVQSIAGRLTGGHRDLIDIHQHECAEQDIHHSDPQEDTPSRSLRNLAL